MYGKGRIGYKVVVRYPIATIIAWVVFIDCCQRAGRNVLHLGLQRIYNPESLPFINLPHNLSLGDQSSHLSISACAKEMQTVRNITFFVKYVSIIQLLNFLIYLEAKLPHMGA